MSYPITYFDSEIYNRWRKNRYTAIIEHYGADYFNGKTLLEVGASNGDFGEMFVQLGANVTSYEGRLQNFNELTRKYPQRKSKLVDLDNEIITEKFDIILHVGLLYHLINFEKHLVNCMNCCKEMIVETEVIDLEREGYFVERENIVNPGASVHGLGTRATTSYIEMLFKEGNFRWEKPKNPRIMNTDSWIYDWTPKNGGFWQDVGLRVMWFCHKKFTKIALI